MLWHKASEHLLIPSNLGVGSKVGSGDAGRGDSVWVRPDAGNQLTPERLRSPTSYPYLRQVNC